MKYDKIAIGMVLATLLFALSAFVFIVYILPPNAGAAPPYRTEVPTHYEPEEHAEDEHAEGSEGSEDRSQEGQDSEEGGHTEEGESEEGGH